MPCVMEGVHNTLYNTKTERKNLLINEAFSFSMMLKNVENAVKSSPRTGLSQDIDLHNISSTTSCIPEHLPENEKSADSAGIPVNLRILNALI